MRLVLFLLVLVTVLAWAPFLWAYWHTFRPWWIRAVVIACAGPWVYVLRGQAKAYDLSIPFDGTSWIGVVAFAVLDAVLLYAIARKPKIRKG